MRTGLLVAALIGVGVLVTGTAIAQSSGFTVPEGWAVTTSNTKAPGEAGYRIEHKESGLELLYVSPGKAKLGAARSRPDEAPVFEADVPGYWIGRTEVTVGQWRKVTGSAPVNWSKTEGDDHPVAMVDWEQCKAFCDKLGLRLPGEIEWEYAARGPESRVYPWGNGFSARWLMWPAASFLFAGSRTAPVGSFPQGASWCGALDMAGNVAEWCADWYDAEAYQQYAKGDLKPPMYGDRRVVRGGSWMAGRDRVFRGYSRAWKAPGDRTDDIGFRVAKSG